VDRDFPTNAGLHEEGDVRKFVLTKKEDIFIFKKKYEMTK
jgi:hypothetical protein